MMYIKCERNKLMMYWGPKNTSVKMFHTLNKGIKQDYKATGSEKP